MCAVLPRWLSGGALRWGASVAVPAEAQSGALQSPRLELLTAKPTPKVAKAERILKIFDEADTGLVMVDGKLIEKPVLRQMQRTLEISKKLKV